MVLAPWSRLLGPGSLVTVPWSCPRQLRRDSLVRAFCSRLLGPVSPGSLGAGSLVWTPCSGLLCLGTLVWAPWSWHLGPGSLVWTSWSRLQLIDRGCLVRALVPPLFPVPAADYLASSVPGARCQASQPTQNWPKAQSQPKTDPKPTPNRRKADPRQFQTSP